MAEDIITELANEKRQKLNRQEASKDAPQAREQYSRPAGPDRETTREKAGRYVQKFSDFRDSLYGYRTVSRSERLRHEQRGERNHRNEGRAARSPIGDTAVLFNPPGMSMVLPDYAQPRMHYAKPQPQKKTKRGKKSVEHHSAFEPGYIPDSLRDLF